MANLKKQVNGDIIRNSLYRVNEVLEKEIKILRDHDIDDVALYLEKVKENNIKEMEYVKNREWESWD